MSITQNKPPVKLTVGAQYITFNTMNGGEWTPNFDEDVTKFPTVVNVEAAENNDSYEDYASGQIYDADTVTQYIDLTTEQIALDSKTIAKMKGYNTSGGAFLGGGKRTRPFFAYGIPVIKKDGTKELRWYPKCKLVENTDRTETSETSHKTQTDTLTIRAYPFNDDQDIVAGVDTGDSTYARITEELFFAAPVMTLAEIAALIPSGTGTGTGTGN
jgi:phi13 family phage major tail protein